MARTWSSPFKQGIQNHESLFSHAQPEDQGFTFNRMQQPIKKLAMMQPCAKKFEQQVSSYV
jgi:hypothetical protein